MILRFSSILMTLLVLVATAKADPGGRDDGDATSPFDDAWLVPDDVTLYVHVERAAALRRALEDRPLAAAFRRLFTVGETAAAWSTLARQAGIDETRLFDEWLGGRCTLILRSGPDATDWALLTTVTPENAASTLHRLRVRRLLPRAGLRLAELPEQELRLAEDGGRVLVGPTRSGGLFDEILPRLAGRKPRAPVATLADHPGVVRGRALGRGRIGVFVTNPKLAGGWSAAVADLAGDRLDLRYAARFDRAPMNRPVTESAWDPAPLAALEDAALVAFAEPTDIGLGPFDVYALRVMGESLQGRDIEGNLGDRRFITIGEVEGRREPHGADILIPTGAVAIEMRDPARAHKQLDARMKRIARALAERVQTQSPVEAPPLPPLEPMPIRVAGETRHLGLEPVLDRIAPGHPIVGSISLNWGIATTPSGSYYVVATHPEHLGQTLAALRAPAPPCDGVFRAGRGKWTSCGTMDGRRVSVHLRTYSDRPDLLGPPDAGQRQLFQDSLLMLSELAGGLNRCRWRLARPSVYEVDLEIQATLSPPESAEGAGR